MGRKSTAQWAYYLGAAIIVAALTLVWQIPGRALAADTGDTWTLTVSVKGQYTYSDTYPGDPPAPVWANVNFNAVSEPFQMVDDGRLMITPLDTLLCIKTPFDSVTGFFTTENYWRCSSSTPQCCPVRYQAKVSLGDNSTLALWVGKAPNRNYFYFRVNILTDGKFCAFWDPPDCGPGYECDVRPLDFCLFNNIIGINYDELRYVKSYMSPFKGTMNAADLLNASYYPLSDSATLTWNAEITINVLSHKPFKKPFSPTLFPLIWE